MIEELINKMFEIAGHNVKYEDIKDREDDWYMLWSMTKEQNEEWIKWGQKFLKKKVKEAVKFITQYEVELVRQAKKHSCKTVISGHIHHPDDRIIDDVRYLNTGDWIENNSYIIYKDDEYQSNLNDNDF